MRKLKLAAAIYFSGCGDSGASCRGTTRPAVTIGPRGMPLDVPGLRPTLRVEHRRVHDQGLITKMFSGVIGVMSIVAPFLLKLRLLQSSRRIICSLCVSCVVVSLSTVAPFFFLQQPENYTTEELMFIGLIACLMFAVTFLHIVVAIGN